jgi:hypothetical protein
MNRMTLNIENKAIWQCACGAVNEGKDYSCVCLAYDVIMIGPGNSGPYPGCVGSTQWESVEDGDKKVIARFADDAKDGDIAVLRHGRATVLGVGVIVGGYLYNRRFGDDTFPSIAGWDVNHCRRVRWLWRGEKHFSEKALAIARFEGLYAPVVTGWLGTLTFTEADLEKSLAELPV